MGTLLTQDNLYFCQAREFAVGGHCKAVPVNLTGSASYATNGDLLDPQAIGAGTKGKIVAVVPTATDSGNYLVVGRRVSLEEYRLMFFEAGVVTEVANATDLSAETFTVLVFFIP